MKKTQNIRNIIDTIGSLSTELQGDTLAMTRTVMDNLKIDFPQGTLRRVMNILAAGYPTVWNACTAKEAQLLANRGRITIAININGVAIVLPKMKAQTAKNMSTYAATVKEIDGNLLGKAHYYTYTPFFKG